MKRVGWLGNLALALLLALDVAMVVLVVRHQGTGAVVQRTPTSSLTTPVTTTRTTTATTGSGPTLEPGLLSVVDDKTAWAADKGSCTGGGASVSKTTDGGATWTRTKAQPYRALSRVDATSATAAFVVGADTSCAVSVRSTTNGGDTWRAPADVNRTWAIDLKNPATLHATTGQTSTPCGSGDVTALARTSDSDSTVLCGDGRTRRTTTSGATWSDAAKAGALSSSAVPLGLTVTGSGSGAQLVLAAVDSGCAGVSILTAPRTGSFAEAACVKVSAASSTPAAVTTEVGRPGTAWLAVGQTLWRSTGDLTAWTKVS